MYVKNNSKYYFLTTRFNNKTWRENINARIKYLDNTKYKDGCLYGSPKEMSVNIPLYSKIFIIEMNNDNEKIEGIGYMYNRIIYNKKYKIYEDNNYNRYIFKGKYYITRDLLINENKELTEKIECLLFKGKDHMKRGQGFTLFTKKKFEKIKKDLFKLVVKLYLKKYSKK